MIKPSVALEDDLGSFPPRSTSSHISSVQKARDLIHGVLLPDTTCSKPLFDSLCFAAYTICP